MRIGFGYDIHKLVKGRKLVLGGIEVPADKGLLGHSDADVLLHAIVDAVLGAAGLGDIGDHFPDTDKKYKDIESAVLLEKAVALVEKKDFSVVNVDAVIILQNPKLSRFKKEMAKNIAWILGIREENVNIKAKTNEGFEAVGKGEAIAAYAVAMLSLEGSRKK